MASEWYYNKSQMAHDREKVSYPCPIYSPQTNPYLQWRGRPSPTPTKRTGPARRRRWPQAAVRELDGGWGSRQRAWTAQPPWQCEASHTPPRQWGQPAKRGYERMMRNIRWFPGLQEDMEGHERMLWSVKGCCAYSGLKRFCSLPYKKNSLYYVRMLWAMTAYGKN